MDYHNGIDLIYTILIGLHHKFDKLSTQPFLWTLSIKRV